jgi:hypothetical protein
LSLQAQPTKTAVNDASQSEQRALLHREPGTCGMESLPWLISSLRRQVCKAISTDEKASDASVNSSPLKGEFDLQPQSVASETNPDGPAQPIH